MGSFLGEFPHLASLALHPCLRAILQKLEDSWSTSNKMMCKITDSQHLKLKKGRQGNASLKFLYYNTIANSNLLQISINRMSVVQASLTLSFLFQYQCLWCKSETIVQCFVWHSISAFRFNLLVENVCTLTHVCAFKH